MKAIQFRTKENIHGIQKGCLGTGILTGGKLTVWTDSTMKNPRIFPFEKIDLIE